MRFELTAETARFAVQHSALPLFGFLVALICCQPEANAEYDRRKACWALWAAFGFLLCGGLQPYELKITGHIIASFRSGAFAAAAIGLSLLSLRLDRHSRVMPGVMILLAVVILFFTTKVCLRYG
jgi:hypothetical protein